MDARAGSSSRVREGKEEAGAKFADYFDFSEPFTKLPSHRILAMFRGEKEEVLDLTLDPDAGRAADPGPPVGQPTTSAGSRAAFGIADQGRPGRQVAARHGALGLAHPDPRSTSASTCACGCGRPPRTRRSRVFAANLRDLLLAAPAGTRATMGLDPGFRTGVKVAVVDAHRQGRRDRHDLPARPAPATGTSRCATLAAAGRRARGRADRDRQRHRVAGDRQARRRADRASTRS